METHNPYENYPEMLKTILSKRHICPTIWKYEDSDKHPNGEIKAEAKKSEYWVNEACAHGYCEYCYGHRFNEWFLEKPTAQQIEEWILCQRIKSDLAEKVKRQEYRKMLHRQNPDAEGQLITLAIDKDYEQVPKLFLEIISVIRLANYDCLIDSIATLEINTENGKRPHIHILTRKVKKPSYVAQMFRRKFIKDKYQVYRVDVTSLPYKAGLDYIHGEKTSKKQEYVQKDAEYKEKNNLLSHYDI